MIYTDGNPTICSQNTQIRNFGIKNYPAEIISHKKEGDKEDNNSGVFTNTNKGGNR